MKFEGPMGVPALLPVRACVRAFVKTGFYFLGTGEKDRRWGSASINRCRRTPILKVFGMCTGYGFKDGNYLDNFAMLWNINKIFGMLEDLIGFKQSYQAFCCFMQK